MTRRWRWDLIAAATVLALGLILSAMLPRYEWQPRYADGGASGLFDRWTGDFCAPIGCVNLRDRAADRP